MISPEQYYEEHLKGKTVQVIRFSTGGYFGGYETKTVTFDEKHLYMESSFSTHPYKKDNVEKRKTHCIVFELLAFSL